MGGIPRLFMAVAQALGSDMGIVIELDSIVILQMPSAERHRKRTEVRSQCDLHGKRVTPGEESCYSRD